MSFCAESFGTGQLGKGYLEAGGWKNDLGRFLSGLGFSLFNGSQDCILIGTMW